MQNDQTEDYNIEAIQSVFEKLIYFRKTVLDKSQETIAEEIKLSQNKIYRLENGQGQLPYLVSLLLHYHSHYRLDVNSVFEPSASIRLLPAQDEGLFDIVEG